MATLPISRDNITNSVGSQLSSPNAAVFGDTPFESQPLLIDSGFDLGTGWIYRSSPNVNASWNSVEKRGFFNHTSPPTGITQPVLITQAIYNGADRTTKLQLNDSQTQKIDEGILGGRRLFTVIFPVNFKDGDIIQMYFTTGYACDIYVRNPGNQTDPTYGMGHYIGENTPQTVNISLNGITAPQPSFNLDIDFTPNTQSAYLDQVMGWWTPSPLIFQEHAYINQTITTSELYNVSYVLDCTGNVTAFQNIQYANLSVQINNTLFWSRLLGGTVGDTRFSMQLPHNLLQKGGDFAIVFHLILAVYSSAAIDFKLFIDDVFLNRTPNTNLLDDSPCITGAPWTFLSSLGYSGVHNPQYELLQLSSTSQLEGGVRVMQQFTKNASQPTYTLSFNYAAVAMTGINHVNMTVNINNTQVGNILQINRTSTSWQEFRVNSTDVVLLNRTYVLNITLAVKPETSVTSPSWVFVLDNLYLYPNWGSDLDRIGSYDGNLSAGQIKEVTYQYNVTGIANTPIRDANVTVFNNDTGIVWGLDLFGSSKFQFINFGNGTYNIKISTIGFSIGLYNLSIVFYRPNFPDTGDFIQLNITGSLLNVTFSSGAHYNGTHKIWFVNEENLPYVDDTTKKITIFVVDNYTKVAITDAFVEAQLGNHTLSWTEVYKSTGRPADKGFYDIVLDTTGFNPYTDYLQLNFSVRVTAQNYSAELVKVTTIVKPLPAAIAVPEIKPFYQGSTLGLAAFLQDTFHGTGIDDANLSWVVVEMPIFNGQLEFILLGFYQSVLPLNGLEAGNYTLRLTGLKINYETSILDQPIEVLPKYNVTIIVSYPASYMEGNTYQATYNFTYTELGGPLVGGSINFFVNYSLGGTSTQENYNLYTGDNGLVTIILAVPMGGTEINITATYGGETNISSAVNSTKITVIGRYAVILEIVPIEYAAELVGGSDVEIVARLTYAINGTPVVGATLLFRVSSSGTSVVTDVNGEARAFVELPTEGSYPINILFDGTSSINATSKQGVQLKIISPATAFINQIIQYAIYAAIIVAIVFGTYIGVSRGVVRPRQRARQAEYVGLMNRFEDARNIQLLMLINRDSGTEIYSKALSGVPVDPTLVSGFLQAITSFGKELLSEEKVESMQGPKAYLAKQKGKAETRILEFHHFKIVLEETAHLRIAILLLKNPSQRLLNALHKFSDRVETRFGATVDQLRGRQLTDEDTWELIDDAFEPSLIYVHMADLVNARSITPTKWEKVVLDEIQRAPFYGEAYLDTLQEQIAHRYIGKELEIVDAGLSLRHKNVLLALSPRYMEVRLTIKKAIDSLPASAKHVILTIGDGESNAAKIIQKVKIPQTELTSIVQQLQELSIITDKLQLDMAGKLVYTTLKVGAEKLKK